MKCVMCKTGDTQPGVTTLTLERDTTTIVFKGVPAQVCQTCGEPYISAEVTCYLQYLTQEAARIGVQVDVRHYIPPTNMPDGQPKFPEKAGEASFHHLICPTEA